MKNDYDLLASIIAKTVREAKTDMILFNHFNDESRYRISAAELAQSRRIAEEFAASAMVNRAEFLKACGID